MPETGVADVAFASTVTELGQVEERPCADPECAGVAEPEQDGDHRYWECQDCGFNFGWETIPTTALVEGPDGTCSVGIPEEVRRAASRPFERAMADAEAAEVRSGGPVPLGPTIGKRPGL